MVNVNFDVTRATPMQWLQNEFSSHNLDRISIAKLCFISDETCIAINKRTLDCSIVFLSNYFYLNFKTWIEKHYRATLNLSEYGDLATQYSKGLQEWQRVYLESLVTDMITEELITLMCADIKEP